MKTTKVNQNENHPSTRSGQEINEPEALVENEEMQNPFDFDVVDYIDDLMVGNFLRVNIVESSNPLIQKVSLLSSMERQSKLLNDPLKQQLLDENKDWKDNEWYELDGRKVRRCVQKTWDLSAHWKTLVRGYKKDGSHADWVEPYLACKAAEQALKKFRPTIRGLEMSWRKQGLGKEDLTKRKVFFQSTVVPSKRMRDDLAGGLMEEE